MPQHIEIFDFTSAPMEFCTYQRLQSKLLSNGYVITNVEIDRQLCGICDKRCVVDIELTERKADADKPNATGTSYGFTVCLHCLHVEQEFPLFKLRSFDTNKG